MTKQDIHVFRKKLMHWHQAQNRRQMPWKGEKDPYKVWLSEIILQQTRVEQGLDYYQKLIRCYPTVQDLASANENEVFKLWEGLGYYSRCKNLLFTAKTIVETYNGQFPGNYEDILCLKGIGPYTAAAIASFAFDLPYAVVDGNVYRVLARYFHITTPSDTSEGKKLFHTLAMDCLDSKQPGAYNQAIMDFGATVCTPANPLCQACPMQKNCMAFEKNTVNLLPVKSKLLQKKKRWFTYFVIEQQDTILVRKRTARDIWQNLHEFLLVETAEPVNWNKKAIDAFIKKEMKVVAQSYSLSEVMIQQLTHQTLYTQFIHITTEAAFATGDYFFQPKTALHKLAFPKTITHYLKEVFV